VGLKEGFDHACGAVQVLDKKIAGSSGGIRLWGT